MLPSVMSRRKGVPLALALVLGGVARRLGVDARLVCAHDAEVLGTESGAYLEVERLRVVAVWGAGGMLMLGTGGAAGVD